MAKESKRAVVLVVLDGWGYRAEQEGNAIALAQTPVWDALTARYPRTLLAASGLAVGLPEHQIGNSEVGHLNLGAGRVVMQDLVRIDRAIADGSFFRTQASVSGRYYGMDRDKRWDRTEKWYRAAVQGIGPTDDDPLHVIRASYERNVTDEFVPPTVIVSGDRPVAPMRDGDVVICFNYRADRMRQIVRALTDPNFDGFDIAGRPSLYVVTMTSYDRTFDVPVAFLPQSMKNIVAEVVSKAGKTMFKTAETEKYAHVTYFFNGGVEPPFQGEDRLLVPSQKVATYDLCPEMSAFGLTDVLCESIEKNEHDFTLCNYANGDMVGHTGSLPATIRAVETVDHCLERVVKSAQLVGARLLVTADHGNCEMMIDPETGGPHTAHTTNPVPLIVIDPDGDRPLRGGGALCDVGPTVLTMLGLERPREMTGTDLRLQGARL